MNNLIFNSNKNKELLWNILYDGGYFNGLDNNKFDIIKNLFERKIIEIDNIYKNPNNSKNPKNVLELNKILIKEIIETIENVKKTNMIERNNMNNMSNNLITNKDIVSNRIEKFQNSLKEKENEFRELITKKKPIDINFSENIDKPIGNEMESILADMINKRQNDLKLVLQEQNIEKANEWIGSTNTNTNDNNIRKLKIFNTDEKPNIHIPIEELGNINREINNNTKKNVTFKNKIETKETNETNDIELNNVLDFLKNKREDIKENKIFDILSEILYIVKDIQKNIKQ